MLPQCPLTFWAQKKRNVRIDDMITRWRKEVGNVPDVINITYKEPVIGLEDLPSTFALKVTTSTG